MKIIKIQWKYVVILLLIVIIFLINPLVGFWTAVIYVIVKLFLQKWFLKNTHNKYPTCEYSTYESKLVSIDWDKFHIYYSYSPRIRWKLIFRIGSKRECVLVTKNIKGTFLSLWSLLLYTSQDEKILKDFLQSENIEVGWTYQLLIDDNDRRNVKFADPVIDRAIRW